MELLAKLGINGGLLLAQIVNFGIVLGVLTLFVYRPLLALLDARTERIRKSIEDVKRIDQQKKELEEFRREQLRKIDEEGGVFLERARKEAEAAKLEIITAAQEEAKHVMTKARQELAEERERMFAEVQHTVSSMIIRMTEKILQREFAPADQKRLLTELAQELPQKLQ